MCSVYCVEPLRSHPTIGVAAIAQASSWPEAQQALREGAFLNTDTLPPCPGVGVSLDSRGGRAELVPWFHWSWGWSLPGSPRSLLLCPDNSALDSLWGVFEISFISHQLIRKYEKFLNCDLVTTNNFLGVQQNEDSDSQDSRNSVAFQFPEK